jgi:hypothetical protein
MIRIARDPEQRRFARISLLTALAAGLVAFGTCLYLRYPDPPAPAMRTLTDYPVLWVCRSDPAHRLTANGRFDPLPCPQCNAPCDILLRYRCPKHRQNLDVFVQFARGEPDDGPEGERVASYRFETTGPWRSSPEGLVPCPVTGCGTPMVRPHEAWSQRALRERPLAPTQPSSPSP